MDAKEHVDEALEAALAQAEAFKAQGNDALKEKNYVEAIRLYTCALQLDPTNAVYLSNRSAAHLANDSKTKALRDAEACIAAKPEWWKGYIRKGAAEHALGRFDIAQSTYFRGLEKDPGNASLAQAIEDVRKVADEHTQRLRQENAEREAIRLKREEEEAAKKAEEDLLASFMNEVDELEDQANTVKKPEEAPREKKIVDFFDADFQIKRLLQPHHEWINLNPFFVLMLETDATDEDIKQHYRKLSGMVHPDKCPDPRAREAFEEIKKAHDQMLNEDRRKLCVRTIENAISEAEAERRKKLKKFKAKDLPPLDEVKEKAVMKAFAEIENRRRNFEAREAAQRRREADQEDEAKEKERAVYQHDKDWSQNDRREKRMGNWTEFQVDGKKAKTLNVGAGWAPEKRKDGKKFGVIESDEYKKKWK
ncbi:hypothetical protein SDRG_04248 [Saprolegnia diclina VS20]|uniref:J domain-containing protein n=1 Tax=Saprolegnia diclina (strain VS20) TaxID=1156394 RepID=T0S7A4_SAPDV|nr:hypothetical protein SDRG_04248 [Saprolegnia diclina VS20]EQC38542.1 hypothetical protein SDRG_04248 [Saprolegnia diclina VS20]|eukprot:XP_008608134.1 hypothetical protein SDRG_04248 [Saprolegnia diclina VS20]